MMRLFTSNNQKQKCNGSFFDGITHLHDSVDPNGAEGSSWSVLNTRDVQLFIKPPHFYTSCVCWSSSACSTDTECENITRCLSPSVCLSGRNQQSRVQDRRLYQGVPADLRVLRRREFESCRLNLCVVCRSDSPTRFTAVVHVAPYWENRLKLERWMRKMHKHATI